MRMLSKIGVLLCLLIAACAPQAPAFPPNATIRSGSDDQPVAIARQVAATAVPQAIIDAADAEYLLLTNVYARLAPSVVNIDVTFAGEQQFFQDAASGSGFVYDAAGHIVTNAHVVADADNIQVTFYDGYVATAELVGADAYSDLAVLRVQVDEARLQPVVVGDSEAVRVGERAIAIGNPFGLSTSMTVGIVSGLGRQLPSADLLAQGGAAVGFQNPSIIQVDAPINPGNSGGPLLNSAGELIGVNTAIRTESGVFEGVGFAVPSSTVQRVVSDLLDDGRVDYSYIGISSQSSDTGFPLIGLAEPLELPVENGVLIAEVTGGSPAERAGLRGGSREVVVRGRDICTGGDIITAVNGEAVYTMDDLVAYLVTFTRPGDTITLDVVRGETAFALPVTLEARPPTVDVGGVRCEG